MTFHLAQINVTRLLAPLDDPQLAEFVRRLPEINALAEESPGFVWRLIDDAGANATALRPFGEDILVNMSVWESVQALRDYAYDSEHLNVLRRRRDWFDHEGIGAHLALWWVPVGHEPTVDEARERLARLTADGPGPEAFTLRTHFPVPM